MADWFHVSSRLNRASIAAHGLDVARMSAAPGIAGSRSPEADGVFLSPDRAGADYFVWLNNTGGPVDVWAVSGVDAEELVDAGSGYLYRPGSIAASDLRLLD